MNKRSLATLSRLRRYQALAARVTHAVASAAERDAVSASRVAAELEAAIASDLRPAVGATMGAGLLDGAWIRLGAAKNARRQSEDAERQATTQAEQTRQALHAATVEEHRLARRVAELKAQSEKKADKHLQGMADDQARRRGGRS